MATIQIRVDENTKAAADSLFSSLGLDTSTAVRIFLVKALEHNGIPFAGTHGGHSGHSGTSKSAWSLQDGRRGGRFHVGGLTEVGNLC